MAQVVDPAQQAQDPDFKPQYHKKKKKRKEKLGTNDQQDTLRWLS
jgi:hypothetical protein